MRMPKPIPLVLKISIQNPDILIVVHNIVYHWQVLGTQNLQITVDDCHELILFTFLVYCFHYGEKKGFVLFVFEGFESVGRKFVLADLLGD